MGAPGHEGRRGEELANQFRLLGAAMVARLASRVSAGGRDQLDT